MLQYMIWRYIQQTGLHAGLRVVHGLGVWNSLTGMLD